MTEQHPITPPPELRRLWAQQAQRMDPHDPVAWMQHVSAQAARWGADQELEACLLVVGGGRRENLSQVIALRDARRPKPPSLKEQALETLRSMQIEPCWINGINTNAELMSKYDILRRALEALDD